MFSRRFSIAGIAAFLLVFAFTVSGQEASPAQAEPPIGANQAAPSLQSQPLSEFATPKEVLNFKFTRLDLELLRQADAFDQLAEERGWVYTDSKASEYLEKLGLTLVPQQLPENVKWRFHVIRDVDANAFALPNGSIYVNTGLLARMENEAQMAGVLAHEITHVVHRHAYLEYRNTRKKTVAIDVILAGSAAYFRGIGGLIVEAVADLLPAIAVDAIFGYRRELEHQADVFAVNTLYQHRYDLREFSRGLDLLGKGPEVQLSREPVFWSSHPKLADRVQYANGAAGKLQPDGSSLLVNRTAYLSSAAGVVRHNAELAILVGRPRTALANALRLVAEDPTNPELYVLLGDAYRSLGARSPTPQPEELTREAIDQTSQRMRKMTLAEYDRAILNDEGGDSRWQGNRIHAEKSFARALELDPQNADAHRGLGYLYEKDGIQNRAADEFKKYLELAPAAKDSRQIRVHLELQGQSPSARKE